MFVARMGAIGTPSTSVILNISMEEDNKIEHDKAEPSLSSLELANPTRRKNWNGWRKSVRVDDPSTCRLASTAVSTSLLDIGRPGFDLRSGHYPSTKVVSELRVDRQAYWQESHIQYG